MANAYNAYEDPRLAASYERGNEMPTESLRAWAELIAGYAPTEREPGGKSGRFGGRFDEAGPAVLEVGAGTGMLCAALARALPDATVTGVEPSAPMRAQATANNAHPRVRYLAGSAEQLPLPAVGFGLALLSRVVHHLPDRPAAARELARVLRPGGRLVIRTTVRERLDAPVYRYWPQLLESDALRFPSEGELLADFGSAGFAVHRVHSYAQPVAGDLRGWRDQLVDRPQSKFLALSQEQFAAGLARLDQELAAAGEEAGSGRQVVTGSGGRPTGGRSATAVEERYDVIVLERTPVAV
ncbi:class I SAM-dependent methyltransferase [Kitasatospora kifunensis]|uniref:SAM-dependent methyltransferase n=1 Tax=Kitasatospora kifunensis TaxID=58351 RepID=A0A7W7R7G5_KITKI|nr:class I SAM-dependent methyltransferase [Kitasatospora kifunensis]MBB4926837.1 SAM-dependent methyltransferase [Kitasatospora kifunensis]